MTNDDRSDQDRTGDGQAPSWGEAHQPTPADEPRYGERAPQAPSSTPQYGEQAPQYGEQAPRYGEQAPQYGQHQDGQAWGDQHGSHQPYAASAAPASAGAPAWQGYQEPKARKKTLGVVAFVLGIASLVIGVIGGYVMGSALGNSDALGRLSSGGADQQELQRQLMSDPAVVSQIGMGAIIAGIAAILGLWALVQGIIAVATKRGRGWGIFAIVLAAVATIATFATYIGIAASSVVGNTP